MSSTMFAVSIIYFVQNALFSSYIRFCPFVALKRSNKVKLNGEYFTTIIVCVAWTHNFATVQFEKKTIEGQQKVKLKADLESVGIPVSIDDH